MLPACSGQIGPFKGEPRGGGRLRRSESRRSHRRLRRRGSRLRLAGAVHFAASSLAVILLRSGLAASAANRDAPGHAIQRQLRHRKFDTTAGYIREGQMFKRNAAGMAGL